MIEENILHVKLGEKPSHVYAYFILKSLSEEKFKDVKEVTVAFLWDGHRYSWEKINGKIREIENMLKDAEAWGFKRKMEKPQKRTIEEIVKNEETGEEEKKIYVKDYITLSAKRKSRGSVSTIIRWKT